MNLPHIFNSFLASVYFAPVGTTITVEKEVLEENRYGKIISFETNGIVRKYFVGKLDGQLILSQE